jgi:hypothetical protein
MLPVEQTTKGSARSRWLLGLRLVLTATALWFVGDRLAHIGTQSIITALPASWLYYGLLILSYFAGPLFDWAVYRRFWPLSRADVVLFLRKRALNEGVVDYAGEVDFYIHMRGHPRAASLIKDVNLLSGFVSNGATVLLLIGLAAGGRLDFLDQVRPGLEQTVGSIAICTGLILGAFAVMHRRVLSTDRREQIHIVSLHAMRLLTGWAFLFAQWRAALPQVPAETWAFFIAVWMVTTRLPFLPSRDLILAALGLALSKLVDASPSSASAMFIAGAAVPLALHFGILVFTGFKSLRSS